jgi:RecJ-like exonuclease
MEQMTICPHCGGNACYGQQVNEEVTTNFCFGCGFSTSTLMKVNSRLLTETLDTSPSLYKDLMYTDDKGQVWFPATVTLPEKGMVFLDGTSKDNWKWAAVKAVEILEEEKSKFPKDQKLKMDTKNTQFFEQRDFMDALDTIGFFDIEVVE